MVGQTSSSKEEKVTFAHALSYECVFSFSNLDQYMPKWHVDNTPWGNWI